MCCTPQNQKASWLDGSEWSYSDWMPGHPNIHTDKPVCVEMFMIGKNPTDTHKYTEVSISTKTSVSGGFPTSDPSMYLVLQKFK